MLLVVNAGSSSIKLAVFDPQLRQVLAGAVTEIGAQARIKIGNVDQTAAIADHPAALQLALTLMAQSGYPTHTFTAAAHRVVHGGANLRAACKISPAIIAQIEACVPLAPLHNPANLMAIGTLATLAPNLPQYACFDTAFHATNPALATTYALPADIRHQGLRRYGFHGISYAGLVETLRDQLDGCLPERLLALHLGNGASLCAILNGKSVATTMGYSPLDGLTMGTRAGGIDGNAVLRLAALHGIDGAADILNRRSGLLALGGSTDMRDLHRAGTPEARFAVDHFCYWAARHAGSMIAAMGGLDAIAFTGGIGENDAVVRGGILARLDWAGADIPSHIIAANEERFIATEVAQLHHAGA